MGIGMGIGGLAKGLEDKGGGLWHRHGVKRVGPHLYYVSLPLAYQNMLGKADVMAVVCTLADILGKGRRWGGKSHNNRKATCQKLLLCIPPSNTIS